MSDDAHIHRKRVMDNQTKAVMRFWKIVLPKAKPVKRAKKRRMTVIADHQPINAHGCRYSAINGLRLPID